MKRIIIVHGWSGSPDQNWLPWLKSELEKQGNEVFVPEMPETDNPIIEKWVSHLQEVVGVVNGDTYFIGHSIGCQTILRYLETTDTLIGGALFVAGWFNLENMETDEEERIAKPWIETPIDIEKIKKVLPKSILLISSNDPYGALQENIEKFKTLGSEIIVLQNGEHITNEIEPAVLEQFLKL